MMPNVDALNALLQSTPESTLLSVVSGDRGSQRQ